MDSNGSFCIRCSEQLARIQNQPTNTVDWFWIPKNTCNEFWSKMVCRNLPVYPWVYYLDRWNKIIPGGNEHQRPSSLTLSRDVEGLFQKNDVAFNFLREEEELAKNWMYKKDGGMMNLLYA